MGVYRGHSQVADIRLVKYTREGSIAVRCRAFEEPVGLRNRDNLAIEIVVSDTGCGIPSDKLESIFREFEQVEASPPPSPPPPSSPATGLGMFCLSTNRNRSNIICTSGLGLAVVARIVEQLGGQLRVDSRIDEGSRFSFLIPFSTTSHSGSSASSNRSRAPIYGRGDQIESLVQALSSRQLGSRRSVERPTLSPSTTRSSTDSSYVSPKLLTPSERVPSKKASLSKVRGNDNGVAQQLRILIVEVGKSVITTLALF